MLSSVSDLLTYIDEKQLTPEFGGTLEYCHSEWVIFRTVCSFLYVVLPMICIAYCPWGFLLECQELQPLPNISFGVMGTLISLIRECPARQIP